MAGGFPGWITNIVSTPQGVYDGDMTLVSSSIIGATYEYEIDGIAGQHINCAYNSSNVSISIIMQL